MSQPPALSAALRAALAPVPQGGSVGEGRGEKGMSGRRRMAPHPHPPSQTPLRRGGRGLGDGMVGQSWCPTKPLGCAVRRPSARRASDAAQRRHPAVVRSPSWPSQQRRDRRLLTPRRPSRYGCSGGGGVRQWRRGPARWAGRCLTQPHLGVCSSRLRPGEGECGPAGRERERREVPTIVVCGMQGSRLRLAACPRGGVPR